MDFAGLLNKITEKEDLNEDEARSLMQQAMSGDLGDIRLAALLAALRTKGETATEIAAFAAVMRENASPITVDNNSLIDTCGTGGDNSSLFNISTLSALVLSSRGLPVAKHGNRAVSSHMGSADILEQLGYPLTESPEQSAARLKEDSFVFLFAPSYHPAMKHAANVRKTLGVRTVFNILGPLANPAKAKVHLLGVFRKNLLAPMAGALQKLGTTNALVVHSEEGFDEISPLAPTSYVEVENDKITEGTFDPAPLKLEIKNLAEIQATSIERGLELARGVLGGTNRSTVEAVALNAVASQYLWEKHSGKNTQNLQEYMESNVPEMLEFILSGKAGQTVGRWK